MYILMNNFRNPTGSFKKNSQRLDQKFSYVTFLYGCLANKIIWSYKSKPINRW